MLLKKVHFDIKNAKYGLLAALLHRYPSLYAIIPKTRFGVLLIIWLVIKAGYELHYNGWQFLAMIDFSQQPLVTKG